MRYVVAVSGGVDSVVLLDMLAGSKLVGEKHHLIVAHFDHGIRQESAEDAAFVAGLAEKYGREFETAREELGAGASEELARERRYEFLRTVAKKHNVKIVTAHHADDVIETIAINLTRGTGWRGLAVLDSPDIWRPLLERTKTELLDYAKKHQLKWVEDQTNNDMTYLRNDLRKRLQRLDEDSRATLLLYFKRQCALKAEIDEETQRLIGEAPYSRYLLTMAPHVAAMELLRAVVVAQTGVSTTRPQRERALIAIKTLQAGKDHDVTSGVKLRFTRTDFIVLTEPEVLS